MSFAVMASHIKKWGSVVAFDFRGHGLNKNEDQTLSQENLIEDSMKVLEYLNETNHTQTFIIVGHSMGGSIACKTTIQALQHEKLGKRV